MNSTVFVEDFLSAELHRLLDILEARSFTATEQARYNAFKQRYLSLMTRKAEPESVGSDK
jgi:hypothetical protein